MSSVVLMFGMLCYLQLPDIGVAKEFCTWARVTLTSDKYLCVRYKSQENDNHAKKEKVIHQKQFKMLFGSFIIGCNLFKY